MPKTYDEVSFSMLTNIHDNSITNWYTLEWAELADMLEEQGHVVTQNKDVALISPWTYKTPTQDFEPRRTKDGELWLIDDEPVVGRLASNVLGTDLIMFDFDGTITTAEAKHLFKPYTYIGYTSYSHRSESKNGLDCFRIVVPLAQFVSAQQLVDRRNAIYADFQGVDKSCLSLARSFYIPSTKPERKTVAYMWRNEGKRFDVLDYAPNVYVPPLFTPVIHQTVDQESIVESLKTVFLGNEPEWFKVALAMQSNDFSFEQFVDVTVGHLMNSKDRRDCEKKWKSADAAIRRGQSMSIGYLINLCKNQGQWSTKGNAFTKTNIDKIWS